jgi:hypothetical protein
MFKCLELLRILKNLGLGLGALALFVFLCGALAIFLLKQFPYSLRTFNELVFPPKEVKHS